MKQSIEILHPAHRPAGRIRAAVFDFDGTISTLRCGWEQVMGPMMIEFLSGGKEAPAALQEEVMQYIDESTGIQTIYQMQWLAEKAETLCGVRRDPWWYKAEYQRRLEIAIAHKKQALADGDAQPEDYRIAGAAELLNAFRERNIALYLASGTDHDDVLHEAQLLGVRDLFTLIAGAPPHQAACSKEAVLRQLFTQAHFSCDELLVVGDGKVEIALGCKAGAFTLGAATDEVHRSGWNPVKRARLLQAGADAIVGDFADLDSILRWLD
ncbi:MAG: HAD family hydrolase [Clostridia bacterium]|nr:HAD family hydrolase [Clostridia bacterium]